MHILVYVGHFIIAVLGLIAIFLLARRRALPGGCPPSRTKLIWFAVPVALGVAAFEFVSFKVSSPPDAFWDFLKAYYPAGRAALEHDSGALRALIGNGAEGGFVNIPVVAYLFAPFSWLPPEMAVTLFTIIGIGLTVAAWFLLGHLARLESRERWLLALLFLVNGPLLNGIKFGNTSYFMVFAMTAGLALLRAQRSSAAGALLGAAAVMKPPLALFGLFFLLRRDMRGVLGFAFVGLGAVVLSLVLFGWPDNLYWLQTSVLKYSRGLLAGSSVQSIPAFIFRLHEPPEILANWAIQAPKAGEKLLAQSITGLLFLIAATACFRPRSHAAAQCDANSGTRRDLQYLLTICLCLVSSPLSWAHYYAWLLVPAAFFLGSQPPFPSSTAARVAGWVAIALLTPIVLWPQSTEHSTFMALYASFAVSHYLFGGVLWFGLIAWWLARTGGLLSPAKPPSVSLAAHTAG